MVAPHPDPQPRSAEAVPTPPTQREAEDNRKYAELLELVGFAAVPAQTDEPAPIGPASKRPVCDYRPDYCKTQCL